MLGWALRTDENICILETLFFGAHTICFHFMFLADSGAKDIHMLEGWMPILWILIRLWMRLNNEWWMRNQFVWIEKVLWRFYIYFRVFDYFESIVRKCFEGFLYYFMVYLMMREHKIRLIGCNFMCMQLVLLLFFKIIWVILIYLMNCYPILLTTLIITLLQLTTPSINFKQPQLYYISNLPHKSYSIAHDQLFP